MKPSLSRAHLEAWRQYYMGFWRVVNAVETDLAAAGLPSLSWYDALYELYLAPDRRLQLCELARHAMLSRSGLSRLIDKLEREGLIKREASKSDGRAAHATLTAKGLAMLRRIWSVYRAGIARHFAAQVSETDAHRLAAMLAPRENSGTAHQAGRSDHGKSPRDL